ncbi:MAG TPA: glycosyltransferase family 4 protein, partial [Pyrinomonadaceae bacterium]
GAVRARRVRVLIVAPSLDILGGQAVQAARLLQRFGEEAELEVGFLPINPRLPGALRKLQGIKYVRTLVTSLLYVWMLLARVRAYDVIHIFSASYYSFVLAPTPAIFVAKLYGKKTVLNYRSGEAEDHLRRWRRTAIPTIRLVDVVAVPSGYLVDVFAQFGLTARSIFNFVDTSRFRFRDRRPLSPAFLSNRNHEPLYNVACVLRAFSLVQKRYPEATLTVVGDGSERAALEQLARELGLRHTKFTGRVEQERMPEFYDAADIYLNAPNIDNMPGSIIESYASGLPVVTTDAGGIPYILRDGETGMLVRRDDHAALAAAAIRLLEDDELAARLTANAHAECRKYSWDAVRREWLKLYRELAGTEAAAEHTASAR